MKAKNNEGEIGSDEPQSEKVIRQNEKPLASPPHEPKIPLTQGFSKSKLDDHFRNFIEILPVIPQILTSWKFYSYFKVFICILSSQNLCFIFR